MNLGQVSTDDAMRDLPLWLPDVLARMPTCSLAVFGDFCVDAYWALHEGEVELSIETGLPVRRVKQQRYSLGGAGNVLTNLAALGIGSLQAIGVCGTDPFGTAMQALLRPYRCAMTQDSSWETMVYAKPCAGAHEESRIDFGSFNEPSQDLLNDLLAQLERAAGEHDVVILNQQVEGGVSSPQLIKGMNAIMTQSSKATFLVDARHHPEKYVGASLKVNMSEAAKLLNEEPMHLHEAERAVDFAARIYALSGKAAFVTRGDQGIAVATKDGVHLIPGVRVDGPTDTVGAGDTVVAAVAAALAAGASPSQAGAFANLAASITVKKLQTTGTASPEEIVAAASSLHYNGRNA